LITVKYIQLFMHGCIGRKEVLSKSFNLAESKKTWSSLDETSFQEMSKEMGIRMGAAAALVK
jgi:hypothetical protein